MKSMFCMRTSRDTPWPSRLPKNASHDGSTFVEVNPVSASYPMCATCLKEPAAGPEIIALSILPPLLDFTAFFFVDPDFALPG